MCLQLEEGFPIPPSFSFCMPVAKHSPPATSSRSPLHVAPQLLFFLLVLFLRLENTLYKGFYFVHAIMLCQVGKVTSLSGTQPVPDQCQIRTPELRTHALSTRLSKLSTRTSPRSLPAGHKTRSSMEVRSAAGLHVRVSELTISPAFIYSPAKTSVLTPGHRGQ